MVQHFRSLGLALLLSVGFGTVAKAASFDCNKAATETEIAICAEPELSALDELMGRLWASQEREPHEVKLQANWLARRNACEGRTSCIAFNYNTHLKALTENETLKCFEQNTDLEEFAYFEEIDADFNGDGTVDKARFSMSLYAEEFEIRLNVLLGPNYCVPAYSWGDGIRNLDGAVFCNDFDGNCVVALVKLNSSNSIVTNLGYYGQSRHVAIPVNPDTYTISFSGVEPRVIGYDYRPHNILGDAEMSYSVNLAGGLVTESLVRSAEYGGTTKSEQTYNYDFDPVSFPNGADFDIPSTVRKYWETR